MRLETLCEEFERMDDLKLMNTLSAGLALLQTRKQMAAWRTTVRNVADLGMSVEHVNVLEAIDLEKGIKSANAEDELLLSSIEQDWPGRMQ